MVLTLLALSGFILGVLMYLFFAPFYLEINSNAGLFRFRLHRAASVHLKVEDNVYLETKILGWTSKHLITLYKEKANAHKTVNKPVIKKKKATRSLSKHKITALVKSFQVKACRISLDTGSMQWNGLLYPAFYWLGWYCNKPIEINFLGKNEVVLQVKNSLARMSWALISSK